MTATGLPRLGTKQLPGMSAVVSLYVFYTVRIKVKGHMKYAHCEFGVIEKEGVQTDFHAIKLRYQQCIPEKTKEKGEEGLVSYVLHVYDVR